MARVSLLSPQKLSAQVHQRWAASANKSYATCSVTLQFEIRYSAQPNGANCSCMAFSTWVSGALHLMGGTWGHWEAAAALPSCILTCCPWLPALFWQPAQRKLISIVWHSRKRHSQLQWEGPAAASMGCMLCCAPWLPAQHSHLVISAWAGAQA